MPTAGSISTNSRLPGRNVDQPRTVTVGVSREISEPTEIYVVIDPDDEISDEITTFNNVAHKRLPEPETETEQPVAKEPVTGFRRGR